MPYRKIQLVFIAMILAVLIGCASSSQVKECEAELSRVKIENEHLYNEVQVLKETLNKATKSLETMKFDLGIIQKELISIKTGGAASTESEAIDKLIEQLKNNEVALPKATKELREYGKPAIVALVRQLKDKDINIVRRIELVFAKLAPSEVIPVLSESLMQPDIRNSAARILGDINDSSAVIPLVERIKDKDNDFVFSVAEALVSLKDRRGIPVLIENLKSDNSSRRALAFDTLSKITGLTFEYKPYLSAEERLNAVKDWENWWFKEGDRFEFKQ